MTHAKEAARGKWAGILGQWLTEADLSGKHRACPACGGKDRFRFDNLRGDGSWICSHCGAGDGLALLQHLKGCSFKEAAAYVERVCGRFTAEAPKRERDTDSIRAALRRVWGAGQKITAIDPAGLYLARRTGLDASPACLRYHPALPYRHDDGTVTEHPAMLAQVVDNIGQPLTIHRTYLTSDGQKAALPTPKKLMTPLSKMGNCAIRLGPVIDWLGVAEGLETALCAGIKHNCVVWSCVSSGLLEQFRPPPDVKMLIIFGDNDRSFTGQASAYNLARAVTALGVECRVVIPHAMGTDWADD